MSHLAPTDWSRPHLSEIGEVAIGLTYAPSQVSTAGTLVLRSSNIQDGQLSLDDLVRVGAEIPEKIRVRPSDILICVRNGSRALIGKSLYLDERVEGETFGAFMSVFRSPYNPYLRFFFQSEDFKRQVDEHLGATINQITNRSLKGFAVSLPPRLEQEAIALVLRHADGLITSLGRLIAKKQAIRQGMMQQLLTGKTRLPGFSVPWTSRRIGDLTRVAAGGTPSTSVDRYWGGHIPWMSSGELHGKRIASVRGRITDDGLRESSAQVMPAGTVLIGLAGQGKTRGTVAVSRLELTTNQSIAGVWPSPEHSSDFLYYNLDTRYEELRGESTGSGGRGGLNLTIIKNLAVFMPVLAEQVAIADVLGDIDDDIDRLSQQLAKARMVTQGMMQELLTGRTRLPVEGSAA